MQLPQLKSPLARAVVPVGLGIGFFAVLMAATWGMASYISHRPSNITNLGAKIFEVGPVESIARAVDAGGPLLFPDLKSPNGTRSIVLDHTGADPTRGWQMYCGWQVYYGHPADSDASCLVTHTPNTRKFTDCNKRTLAPEQLALPTDVRPIVENRTTLFIDLRGGK